MAITNINPEAFFDAMIKTGKKLADRDAMREELDRARADTPVIDAVLQCLVVANAQALCSGHEVDASGAQRDLIVLLALRRLEQQERLGEIARLN